MNRTCPIHNIKLEPVETQYGLRYDCPIHDCTICMWNGNTSTPADYQTRQMRGKAHLHFDNLWHNKKERNKLYKKLAQYLGLDYDDTHIGMFSYEQCEKVIEFTKQEKNNG